MTEAKVLVNQWRREYDQIRPHSAWNYQPPASETILTGTTKKSAVALLVAGQIGLPHPDSGRYSATLFNIQGQVQLIIELTLIML